MKKVLGDDFNLGAPKNKFLSPVQLVEHRRRRRSESGSDRCD